ncbi:BURP domain protein RD22-like [Prunus yedoensis var. nudiflora]|uniref:BURP domain protein RD22-like n=1 Tax=Prunus yedoensis var. nudiflora TaxID=2094558 RepID=A0A314ZU52_PRUYE|nr:BURP domain protein RD22-like [Prunus yedoensis var. nudiflora]
MWNTLAILCCLTSKLGTRNVQAVSTELLEKGVIKSLRKYTVSPGVKKLGGDEAVACHKQRYPFPMFYCHSTKQTESYVMSMKGADGEKVKVVAMCHIDTSEWNPRHSAFQVLKVKPGTVPICHILPEEDVVWVSNDKSA